MALTAEHNPLSMVIDAANELWPDLEAVVVWVSEIPNAREGETIWGQTRYSDGKGTTEIMIRADMPLDGTCDVLAHEIAHVVAGPDADHGPEWEAAFQAIYERYGDKVRELHDTAEAQA